MKRIEVTRKTTESQMSVILDFSPLKKDYRNNINTPIPFLNHMIEHIAWRSSINIITDVKMDKFCLNHLICEDLGIAFGKAVAEYINKSKDEGVVGYSDAYGIIDEARAHSLISFESRSYFDFDRNGIIVPENVENMYSEDLETFLEGFAQGANCTYQLVLEKGHNAHHIWEAIFRSLGAALGLCTKLDSQRKGMTSGVAGNIEWEIK